MATRVQRKETNFVRACTVEQLKAGGPTVLRGHHLPVLLVNDRGGVRALGNRCPRIGEDRDQVFGQVAEQEVARRRLLVPVGRCLAAHSPTERAAFQTADIARRLVPGGVRHEGDAAGWGRSARSAHRDQTFCTSADLVGEPFPLPKVWLPIRRA